MSKPSTDISLTEQADRAFTSSDWQTALAGYATILLDDPTDLYVWYRTAVALTRLGERDAGMVALRQACEALAELGQVLLAIVAAQDVARLDEGEGARLVHRIASLYGAGSQRVDRERRPPPPPPPRTLATELTPGPGDPATIAARARDACEAAHRAYLERRAKGVQSLPFQQLLCELPIDDFVALVPLMKAHVFREGHLVIEQGSEGTSMFIVVRGSVEISRDGVHLARLRSGSFFGEMSLLTHSPRAARVVCSGPALLLELDSEALEQLAGSSPNVARVLADHARLRLLRNLMATSPLFRPLDPARREGLIDLFTTRVYRPGEVVVSAGSESEGLHIVLSGGVEVVQQSAQETTRLADLGPGDLFGEISLIQRRQATATVVAARRAVVLCLPREAFNQHVAAYPEVLAHVYQTALEREEANKRLEEAVPIEVDGETQILL